MKLLLLCADWGVPLDGDAGSSVHFRSMAKALSAAGHEVRIIAAGEGDPAAFPWPVRFVPKNRWWPRIFGLLERVRGRGDATAATPRDVAPAPTERPDAADPPGRAAFPSPLPPLQIAPPEPADSHELQRLSWRTRLLYRTLPRMVDRWEELVGFRRRFGEVAAATLADWEPDAVYERYALGQTGGALAARRAGVPHLLEVNAPLTRERAERGDLSGWLRRRCRRDEVALWTTADRVFCVSEPLRELVVGAGAAPERVLLTPNGVDTEIFAPERGRGRLRDAHGLGNAVLVGWLGSLSPGRGVQEFLAAMPEVLRRSPGACGVVIGGGPLLAELRAVAARSGCGECMVFTGPVPHDDVPDCLADLDVAVACYPERKDFYFSPMKVYEYLASGLPTVAGDMGQMRELLDDGRAGVLLPPGDTDAWIEALTALVADAPRRAELSRRARARALSTGSWLRNAEIVAREAAGILAETEMEPSASLSAETSGEDR